MKKDNYKIATIQMVSSDDLAHNLQRAADLIQQARERDAAVIVLPENFAFMGKTEQEKLDIKEKFKFGTIQHFLQEQARKHKVWLVGGTIPLATENEEKVRSSCLLLNAEGELVGRYDKIHLFDVKLSEEEYYTESAIIQPGNKVVVVDTPYGYLGLSVCYDLRFPELYRAMVAYGAEVLIISAAFTAKTGRCHWEVLLRARAIENLTYVVAANQGGLHTNGRQTYGHSMIVEPWGQITACCNQGEDVVIAEIDLAKLYGIRKNFPSIRHRTYFN